MNKTLKKYWWLSLVFIALTTMISFSCLSGDDDDDDDDDDNNTDDGTLGACCSVSNECSIDERLACKDDGGRWLGEEIRCVPNPCGNGDDDDNNDTGPDDDDDDNDTGDDDTGDDDSGDDDDTEGNQPPHFFETIWFVNDIPEIYPDDATATMADTVGVGFIWADEECNLIGGYGTYTLTVDGVEEAPVVLGPYSERIGCAYEEIGMAIGFFYSGPIPSGVYEWVFTATDAEGATSQEQTGTFTITHYGDDDDDDDCEGNTAPTYEETIWIVNDLQYIYPAEATATIADLVGVGFIWEDAECNLIGGYANVTTTMQGQTESFQLGPYTDIIGCSTEESAMLIGFFYDEPLPAGVYDWTWNATDICDATSNTMTGTFTIVE